MPPPPPAPARPDYPPPPAGPTAQDAAAPRQHHAGRAVAGVAAALVLLLFGAGAVWAYQRWVAPDPQSPTAGPVTQEPETTTPEETGAANSVDLRTEPALRWQRTATDLLPGASYATIEVAGLADRAGANTTGLTVLTASSYQDGSVIAGVDSASGETTWQIDTGNASNLWCWLLDAGEQTLCAARYGEWGEGTTSARLLDTRTGDELSTTADIGFTPSGAAVVDGDLVLGGYTTDVNQLVFTRGTPTQVDARWRTTTEWTDLPGTHFWTGFAVNERYVAANVPFLSAVVQLDDGELVAQSEPGSDVGSGVEVRLGAGSTWAATDSSTNTSEAHSDQGDVSGDGLAWRALDPSGAAPELDGLVGLGPVLYQASDGSTVAQIGTAPDDVVVSDGLALAQVPGMLQAFEVPSGTSLWQADFTGSPYAVADSGGVLVVSDSWDGAVVGLDRSTGARLWTVTSPDAPPEGGEWYTKTPTALDGHLLLSNPYGSTVTALGFAESGAQTAAADPELVTACGTPPRFVPVTVSDDAGALHVELQVSATCPAGDVLSGAVTSIVLREAGSTVAAGTFDFSASPLLVPLEGTRLTLTFPVGQFWRTAADLDPTAILVACERDPAEASTATPLAGAVAPTITSTGPAATVNDEDVAYDALRWQADQDYPRVLATLDGLWTPQLSSKQPGLEADGMTWDNRATYDEHLSLRLAHPGALLLRSGEWPTYLYGDFWVTVAGVGFATPEEANAWCESAGYDAEHCYAKLIDSTGTPEGATTLRS